MQLYSVVGRIKRKQTVPTLEAFSADRVGTLARLKDEAYGSRNNIHTPKVHASR
jgi:hypothetical protein